MLSAANEAKAAELLEPLCRASAELAVKVERYVETDAPDPTNSAKAKIAHTQNVLRLTADSVRDRLAMLKTAARKASQARDLFKADHKITRDLKRPNLLGTTALISLGWTVETVFTAISLLADGYHDLVPALGFGATFSTATVAMGILAGQLCRFVSYRRHCTIVCRQDMMIRRGARVGLAATLAAQTVLIFTGGRTRVLGGHDGIFDFSEVSFLDTFGDGLAIVIMVWAALSFLLAMLKGYSGFTDPIPGYADHVGHAAEDVAETAEILVEDALELIDEIGEDTEEDLLDLWEPSKGADALRKQVHLFNAKVEDAKNTLKVFAIREWEDHCIVAGQEVPFPQIDVSGFDDLKVDPKRLCFAKPQQGLLDELRQAQSEAASRAMAALSDFSAELHGGVVLPPIPTANQ